jgi:hypothetical protein
MPLAGWAHSSVWGSCISDAATCNGRDDDPATLLRYAEQALATEAHLVLADLHRSTGTLQTARVHAEAGRGLADQLGGPRLLGLSWTALARVDAQSGDLTSAARSFAQAPETLAVARMPFERALALQAYAVEVVGRQEAECARALLAETLGLLEGLGACPATDGGRALRDGLSA